MKHKKLSEYPKYTLPVTLGWNPNKPEQVIVIPAPVAAATDAKLESYETLKQAARGALKQMQNNLPSVFEGAPANQQKKYLSAEGKLKDALDALKEAK